MGKGMFAGLAVGVLGLLMAGAAMAQGKGETVRIHDYPGVGNMLHRVAIDRGFCKEHGITCVLQVIPSGPLGMQAMMAKSIEVSFAPLETQINAMLKGSAIKSIMAGSVANPFQLLVPMDSSVPMGAKFPESIKALKGKKIGVTARGSSAEIVYNVLLNEAGMKPEDVTYVAIGAPNTAYAALTTKQVDAAVTFEPAGTLCDATKACRSVYDAFESPEPKSVAATNGAYTGYQMTQAYIDANPHVVAALRAATAKAEAFLQNPANFEEVVKIALNYFKFDMPGGDLIMAASVKRAIPSYHVAMDRNAAKAMAAYLLSTKQIDAPFDTARLFADGTP